MLQDLEVILEREFAQEHVVHDDADGPDGEWPWVEAFVEQVFGWNVKAGATKCSDQLGADFGGRVEYLGGAEVDELDLG